MVESAGETVEREIHGEFVGMESVGIEMITEVKKIVVEEAELFGWSCLPGEEGGGEWRR